MALYHTLTAAPLQFATESEECESRQEASLSGSPRSLMSLRRAAGNQLVLQVFANLHVRPASASQAASRKSLPAFPNSPKHPAESLGMVPYPCNALRKEI